jgi:hypothetical protein
MAENLSPKQVSHAIEICRKAPLPIQGLFVQIGLIEFRPIKEICAFLLKPPKSVVKYEMQVQKGTPRKTNER